MADELTLRIIASSSNDVTPDRFDESVNDDQSTEIIEAGGQTVGTTHEVLDLGDVTSPAFIVLRNADTANYVEIGLDDTGAFVPVTRIRPGLVSVIQPASGVTLYARANTAAIRLDRFIPST